MKKQLRRILMMTLVLISLMTTMVFADVDPLTVPDYTSTPGSYGVPSDATTGLDAQVQDSCGGRGWEGVGRRARGAGAE